MSADARPANERSAFEAWCPTAGIVDWSRAYGDDSYTRPRTQFAWEVWQAARRSPEPGVHPDTARLDWLNGLGEAYGFEDTMEGYKWVIDGPYNNVREGIDHGMSFPPTKGDSDHG